jgi:CBS domain containing-hemolysin-like protein
MDLPPLASILIVLFLIFANGFFVSAEFALVSVRATRIEQLAAAGSVTARLVLRAQADPNRFISAAQLGITVASLLLGWLGEETFARLFEGPLSLVLPHDVVWISSHGIASILAIVLITFLHISIGEQVPKMLALQRAESVIMFTTPPTELVARVFRPFITVLYGFTNVVLRVLRLEFKAEDHALHSPEELRLLVGRSARAGLLSPVERQLVERAFAFSDLTAEEVMVPRTEVAAINVDASMQEVVRTLRRFRHSRFPVYEGTIDNVIGVLSAKDLVGLRSAGQSQQTVASAGLRRLLRPPVLVPEGAEASEVLARMKAARQPLAVVLDEYGGTAGIVTLKNLVSRLLGDIGDEFAPAAQELRVLGDGSVVADGLMLIEDVNEQLGTHFDASEVDTLGGLVFARLGRRPRVGDDVDLGSGYTARVESLDGLRIARVRLIKHAAGDKTATT